MIRKPSADSSSHTTFSHMICPILHGTAVYLSGQQQRINDRADVVDHAVAHDFGGAGIWIDFDLSDVTPVGKSWRRRRPGCPFVETKFEAGRRGHEIVRMPGRVRQVHGLVSACDGERAVVELDILDRDFQMMGN